MGDFRVSLEWTTHSRITISDGEPNRGGLISVVVGQCETAGQRPVATQHPEPADAGVWTVRPPASALPSDQDMPFVISALRRAM